MDTKAPGRIGNRIPLLIDQLDRRNLELSRELPSWHLRSFGQPLCCPPSRPPFVGKPKVVVTIPAMLAFRPRVRRVIVIVILSLSAPNEFVPTPVPLNVPTQPPVACADALV